MTAATRMVKGAFAGMFLRESGTAQLQTPAGPMVAQLSVPTISRPATDVTTSGWISSNPYFWSAIDEPTAEETEYIVSPTLGSPVSVILQLARSVVAGTYAINIRIGTNLSSGTLRVYLLNNSNTSQGVTADQAITTTPTTYNLAITISGTATRMKIEVE